MALDLGDSRIGIAVTDPLGYTAQPLMTLFRQAPRADLRSIARLVRRHEVREIVIGKPLRMSGEAGRAAHKAEVFAETLRAEVRVPIHLIDERLTTWEAHEILDQSPVRRTRNAKFGRKHLIDQVAAVLILENFLQAREAERMRARR